MITITLQKIRDIYPRDHIQEVILLLHRHLKMDVEFPLASVIERNSLAGTLWCLRCLPEYDSLWRKYAVWCGRQVENLMTDERSRNALNVAWRHSNGDASDDELADARTAAMNATSNDERPVSGIIAGAVARLAAGAAVGANAGIDVGLAAWCAIAATEDNLGNAAGEKMRHKQQQKLIAILTAGEWVEDSDSEQLRAGGE